jgi:transposase
MAKEEPKRLELTHEELEAFFERLERNELTTEDRGRIREIIEALLWMSQKLEHQEISLGRLKRLFGVKTEKASALFGKPKSPSGSAQDQDSSNKQDPDPPSSSSAGSGGGADRNRSDESKPAGKNGKNDYPGAECIFHPHESLKVGDACPLCGRGTLYSYGVGSVVRLRGQPPVVATVHQPEQLRCSSCQGLLTAKLPESVGEERADETAKAIVSIFRYGSGIPFYRNEKLQDLFQTPLPDSSQWDLAESVANAAHPVFKTLIHQAAQGELLGTDDTGMRVIQLKKMLELGQAKRTGIQTTGVLSQVLGHEIALFFTGNRHAGENLAKILKLRDPDREIPKLMCDAAAKNRPKATGCQMGSCLDHARRYFVDIIPKYADEAEFFIETLKDVYRNDKRCKRWRLSAEARLAYHAEQSLPVMEGLKLWCEKSLETHVVEPNSPLGAAMNYFLNHYDKLTMFAKIEGMPLSNSAVERLLKTAVLHRKNSLFYQTETGALVGDVLMSVIQTAKRAQANVLDYLAQLQRFAADVRKNPQAWLPWNYLDRLAILQPVT